MSYDIYLSEPRCEHCKRDGREVYDRNMTSNVSGIWYRALMVAKGNAFQADIEGPWHDELGAFGPLAGVPGEKAAGMCLVACDHILANEGLYRPFEPDNGWGTAVRAAGLLHELGDAWRQNPTAVLRVSR